MSTDTAGDRPAIVTFRLSCGHEWAAPATGAMVANTRPGHLVPCPECTPGASRTQPDRGVVAIWRSDADAEGLTRAAMERLYLDQVEGVARKLEQMAAAVRTTAARPVKPVDGHCVRVAAAAQVVHSVTWGVANLNMEALISYATNADMVGRT